MPKMSHFTDWSIEKIDLDVLKEIAKDPDIGKGFFHYALAAQLNHYIRRHDRRMTDSDRIDVINLQPYIMPIHMFFH